VYHIRLSPPASMPSLRADELVVVANQVIVDARQAVERRGRTVRFEGPVRLILLRYTLRGGEPAPSPTAPRYASSQHSAQAARRCWLRLLP
jgi:hypothetical protein